jgi:signal transduction histidine kinase
MGDPPIFPTHESSAQTLRGFSHDIRNLLHAADGFAQLMEERHYGPLTLEQVDVLHRLRSLLGNATKLITDMLETERVRLAGPPLEVAVTEINSLVRELVEGHRAEAELRGLAMSVHAGLPELWLRTDPTRVRQILDNLIGNALKFTSTGAIVIDVSVRGSGRGDTRPRIQIAVSDTGPGIARADYDRIFEEFVRVGAVEAAGQGIGLAMSRILAHLVGGEITVESDPGEGSTFTLSLPAEALGMEDPAEARRHAG